MHQGFPTNNQLTAVTGNENSRQAYDYWQVKAMVRGRMHVHTETFAWTASVGEVLVKEKVPTLCSYSKGFGYQGARKIINNYHITGYTSELRLIDKLRSSIAGFRYTLCRRMGFLHRTYSSRVVLCRTTSSTLGGITGLLHA